MNRSSYIVAFACIGLLARGAQGSKILDAPPGGVGRVAEFYEAVSEIDRSACQQILGSLNEEYVIRDVDAYPRVSVTTDAFLWSDLQIPWMRTLVQKADPHDPREVDLDGPGALNIAKVKITGRTLTIFRQDMERHDEQWDATLSINRLWIADRSPLFFPSDRKLTQNDLALTGGAEVLLKLPDRVPRGSTQRNLAAKLKSSEATEPLLLNAITVNGNLYLLALDAGEAEVHAPRGGDGTVDVYALKFHSETDVRFACLFRSL